MLNKCFPFFMVIGSLSHSFPQPFQHCISPVFQLCCTLPIYNLYLSVLKSVCRSNKPFQLAQFATACGYSPLDIQETDQHFLSHPEKYFHSHMMVIDYHDYVGKYSAFTMNLTVSVLFVVLFFRRKTIDNHHGIEIAFYCLILYL